MNSKVLFLSGLLIILASIIVTGAFIYNAIANIENAPSAGISPIIRSLDIAIYSNFVGAVIGFHLLIIGFVKRIKEKQASNQ